MGILPDYFFLQKYIANRMNRIDDLNTLNF